MLIKTEDAAYHRLRISSLFRGQLKGRDLRASIWNYIIKNELMIGSTFIVTKPDRNLYAVLGATNEILSIPRRSRGGDRFLAYIHQMYGLEPTENYTKTVYDLFRSYALGGNGITVELRRFAAYNSATKTAYMSTYTGHHWKIDGKDITRIPTGEDEVFFIDDDGGVPVEPDIGPHGLLLDYLTSLNFAEGIGGITAEQQRKAMIVWIFALAFPDLMPTKPLLMLEGAMGSGKSAAVQLVQLILMGAVKPMTISKNQEADFGVILLRSPIAVLDNVDTYIDWVADKICSYTTNGTFPKRKLFTDDEEVVIKPHAFLAVASKNPASFRREDVADRCIIIRLDRRERFTRFAKLQEESFELRPKLFGEYLYYVNRIVEEIRGGAYDESATEIHRMADYAALARVVGKVLGWTIEDVEDMMAGLQNERDAFINEEDPLVDLLNKWLEYPVKMGPINSGRPMDIHMLFKELNALAEHHKIQWYKHSRTLSQKLRSAHISEEFDIRITAVDGHKIYRIWRRTQLRLVPDEPEQPIEVGESEEDPEAGSK